MAMDNNSLVNLVAAYTPLLELKSPRDQRVLDAMRRVDRKMFIPSLREVLATVADQPFLRETFRAQYDFHISDDPSLEFPDEIVYHNGAIPIGYNQTCSQPSVVAFMADLLEIKEGMNILEVGTGCGYNAAILTKLVGPTGHVTSVERIAELAALAQRNLEAHFGPHYQENVSVILADGSMGQTERAPYDAIILTAGIESRSFDFSTLLEQVPTGIFLYPEHRGPITRDIYQESHLKKRETFGNFGFVPLQKGAVNSHDSCR